jgi:3-oxoacyl-[acyl-carrier protein] reductase
LIYVRGADSAIARALGNLEEIRPVERGAIAYGTKYLFCVGRILQKQVFRQTQTEIDDAFRINAGQVIADCDALLDSVENARICVVGSESGIKGSFDMAYAAAKAGLHKYVETKRLKYPGQQLVCVAPTCVLDTNMNKQRNADGVAALEARRLKHPKQRWLQPIEVARVIHFLLSEGNDYVTNTVIRVNGGEHCA